MKKLKIVTFNTEIIIDDEDYNKLKNLKIYLTGSSLDKSRVSTIINEITIPITSIIMGTKDILYDHIDRNAFNNQKSNLRICTQHQNSMNRGKYLFKKSSSKYKGVSWSNTKRLGAKRWKSGIKYNGRQIHLGYFEDEWDAALAYNVAAIKYFKEFAVFNVKNIETV